MVKVYSVRLEGYRSISDKCLKVNDYNGNSALIPKSQFFGPDYDVLKGNAYWVAAWLIDKGIDVNVARKKVGWYNPATKKIEPDFNGEPSVIVEHHIPDEKKPVEQCVDPSLLR